MTNHVMLAWAHGRLAWAIDAIDHIERHGFEPNDQRVNVMAEDMAIIVQEIPNHDRHSQIQRVQGFINTHQKYLTYC